MEHEVTTKKQARLEACNVRLPIALIKRLESWFGPLTEETFTAAVVSLLDDYETGQRALAPWDRDESYERSAARARSNDFVETGGKNWT